MQTKKITSIWTIFNSLVDLLHNILLGTEISEEEIFYSLFGIIVVDLIINKEEMVFNVTGQIYESLMSDNQLEDILNYLDIENIDKNKNGASIYATIRNKLAHGDYYLENDKIIFNINDKECKVDIKEFINYYLQLTKSLKARYKETKYIKNKLVDKTCGNFDDLLTTKEDIKEFLKFLTFKEFILRRKDNKELSSIEKNAFVNLIDQIYENKCRDEKKCDKTLMNTINQKNYILDIKNKKVKKIDDETLEKVEKIIEKYNYNYDYNKEYINNILYQSAEDIYKLMVFDYEHYGIKYGLANLKEMLNQMQITKTNDFDKFVEKCLKVDNLYYYGLPLYEMIIGIIVALIYFDYCYPLEKIYKNNKTIIHDIDDLDFSKLNFKEIDPSINKLYDIGKDTYINEEKKKINSHKKNYEEKLILLKNKTSQIDNLIKIYKNTKDETKKTKIIKLTKEIENIEKDFEFELHSYYNELERINELEELFNNKEMNFYNYTVINGIRNAISHGNISCNNITAKNLKDLEIEFIDFHENEIKFKLNIKIYNLVTLVEEENIKEINNHLMKKLIK